MVARREAGMAGKGCDFNRSLHLPEIGPRIRLELRFSPGFRATLGQTLE